MRALWGASVLGGLAQALAGTAGGLLARQVSGSDAVAGLPQALLVAGSAVAALGLSALTVRRGRRTALSTGAAVAMIGCAVVIGGAVYGSLLPILAGSALLGAGNTAVMLGRYAAADLGPEAARPTAMAAVLAATTVGAVAGPNLLLPAGVLAGGLGLPGLAGPYGVAAVGFAAAAVMLAAGLRPVTEVAPPAGGQGPDPRLPGEPVGRSSAVGLGVLTVANLVMVAVMTMAPIQLHHLGGGLGVVGLVVSLHIAGMFAPSPLSGWLTSRIGGERTAVAGGAVLTAACALAAAGAGTTAVLAVAMALLGVGWNLALVAGSALLTADVPARLRPRLEGRGEIGMGVAAAGGGAASGAVAAAGGYSLLAVAGAVCAVMIPVVIPPLARRASRAVRPAHGGRRTIAR